MKDMADYELTTKILLAMIMGVLVGLTINVYGFNEESFVHKYIVDGLFVILGKMFIDLLKMLVVPLVLFSLIAGVISIGNITKLGRIGLKSFFLYMFTTAMATMTAMLLAIAIIPEYTNSTLNKEEVSSIVSTVSDELKNKVEKNVENIENNDSTPFVDVLSELIPENIFEAFLSGNMLQIIFFAVFFAITYLSLANRNQNIEDGIETINQTIMKMVHIVTKIAPIAVFALIAKPIADLGLNVLVDLSSYIFVLILALFIHLFGTLMLLLKFSSGLSPRVFLHKMRETQFFAFSTASSNATMPSTLQTLSEKMGVKRTVSSFTVPFGATINMDGTAMMQGVATIFIAYVYNIDLTFFHYFLIIGMSVLASIGTAGVPGVGLIMLAMVFDKLQLPPEGIVLLLSVDRILDMLRTIVNVSGDAVVTCIIAKQEKQLDESVYYNLRAGISDEELNAGEGKRVFEEMLKSGKYEFEIDEDGKTGRVRLKEDL